MARPLLRNSKASASGPKTKALMLRLLLLLVLIGQLACDTPRPTSARNPNQQQQQRRQLVKKYKRPSNLGRLAGRISCPICASDFMGRPVMLEDPCFNPRSDLLRAELELITECPLAARNCTTETVYVNGVLTSIKRKCGGPGSRASAACSDGCVVAGLGLTTRTCSVCCPPFDYDAYNTDSSKPRECA